MKSSLHRPYDFVSRYGGEEFAIILSNTNVEGALQVSEVIQAQIKDLQIPHLTSQLNNIDIVTLGIGIATLIPTPLQSESDLVHYADNALYQAKSSGRNRIAIYK